MMQIRIPTIEHGSDAAVFADGLWRICLESISLAPRNAFEDLSERCWNMNPIYIVIFFQKFELLPIARNAGCKDGMKFATIVASNPGFLPADFLFERFDGGFIGVKAAVFAVVPLLEEIEAGGCLHCDVLVADLAAIEAGESWPEGLHDEREDGGFTDCSRRIMRCEG